MSTLTTLVSWQTKYQYKNVFEVLALSYMHTVDRHIFSSGNRRLSITDKRLGQTNGILPITDSSFTTVTDDSMYISLKYKYIDLLLI